MQKSIEEVGPAASGTRRASVSFLALSSLRSAPTVRRDELVTAGTDKTPGKVVSLSRTSKSSTLNHRSNFGDVRCQMKKRNSISSITSRNRRCGYGPHRGQARTLLFCWLLIGTAWCAAQTTVFKKYISNDGSFAFKFP